MTADALLSARDAQAVLGCSRWFLTEHAAELGAVKVGNRLKFTRAGLDTYIARQTVKAPAPIMAPSMPAPRRSLSVVGLGPVNPLDGRPWETETTPAASSAAGRARSTGKEKRRSAVTERR